MSNVNPFDKLRVNAERSRSIKRQMSKVIADLSLRALSVDRAWRSHENRLLRLLRLAQDPRNDNASRGFTLPELLIVMAILSILLGFIVPNLLRSRQRSVLNTTVDTLTSDLKSQQNKAMVGDTEGSGTISDYGIHFEANRYILFRGSSYDPLSTSNFNVDLDPSLTFSSITLLSSRVVFNKGSGETGLVGGSDTVTLTDSTNGDQKIIQINRYGAIAIQ